MSEKKTTPAYRITVVVDIPMAAEPSRVIEAAQAVIALGDYVKGLGNLRRFDMKLLQQVSAIKTPDDVKPIEKQ